MRLTRTYVTLHGGSRGTPVRTKCDKIFVRSTCVQQSEHVHNNVTPIRRFTRVTRNKHPSERTHERAFGLRRGNVHCIVSARNS